MTLIEFVALSTINLGIIVFVIRKRSIVSAEGLCMAYLGMAVVTDNIDVVFHYLISPDVLPLGHRELAFRLYPTAVQILGLVVLMTGLWAADAKASRVFLDLDQAGLLRLRNIGIAVAIIGLGLTCIALYLVGALSSLNFYAALSSFRSEALPFGGFWYRGADVAVFGMALTLPSLQARRKCFFAVLALMMFVSFFLRTNKGGLEEPILWGALVLFVYNRKFFRTLLNVKTTTLAVMIAFLGIGAKLWFLPRAMDQTVQEHGTFSQLVKMAAAGASTRWSDEGLYRGYCQFVNSLPDNRFLFQGSKVGIYSLISWVPRLFYPNKPDHPFRGLGFAVYADFHTYPNETPAPMLAGSAMADDGFTSLIAYLFVAGLFLGWLRRFATAESGSLYRHCGYLFFVLFGGFSAEEGTLGLVYMLLLAYGVLMAARLLPSMKELVVMRRRTSAPVAASIDEA